MEEGLNTLPISKGGVDIRLVKYHRDCSARGIGLLLYMLVACGVSM